MKRIPVVPILGGLFVVLFLYFFPWRYIDWGNVSLKPSQTITVQGSAKTQVVNQKALFTAGVNAVNDSRELATTDVNKKIEAIVAAIKELGIPEEDIKTQNMNIFQNEESYYDGGVQKSRLGQWRVNTTVEITVKDMNVVNTLPSALTAAGANNVWGPNYSLDNTDSQESQLLTEAVDAARIKAEGLALSVGKKLGQVLSITEGTNGILYPALSGLGGKGAGGGGGFEPGTGTVQKDVTVTFELK